MTSPGDRNLDKRSHITLYLTEERREVVRRILAEHPEKSLADAVFTALSETRGPALPGIRRAMDAFTIAVADLPVQIRQDVSRTLLGLIAMSLRYTLISEPESLIGRPLSPEESDALWKSLPRLEQPNGASGQDAHVLPDLDQWVDRLIPYLVRYMASDSPGPGGPDGEAEGQAGN